MKSRKQVRYSGVLVEPIAPRIPSLISALRGDADTAATLDQYISDATISRFLALFAHYGIAAGAEGSALQLALALARDHVPGFKIVADVPRRRGRPRTWDDSTDWELMADVNLMTAQGHTVANACRILASRKRWSFAGKKRAQPSGATLVRRYNAIVRSSSGPAMLAKHSLSVPELRTDFLALFGDQAKNSG